MYAVPGNSYGLIPDCMAFFFPIQCFAAGKRGRQRVSMRSAGKMLLFGNVRRQRDAVSKVFAGRRQPELLFPTLLGDG
jgi:hypothetical protein